MEAEASAGGSATAEAAASAPTAAEASAPAREAACGSFPRPPPAKRPSDKDGEPGVPHVDDSVFPAFRKQVLPYKSMV